MLWFMGWQRVRHDLVTEQQQYLVLNYMSTNSAVDFSLNVNEFCEAYFWVWLLFRQ